MPRTQRRTSVPSALERVRQAAKRDRQQRFNALLHHVYDDQRLRLAYGSLKGDAAAGVDGETWRHFGERLEDNLRDLSERLQHGAYRAKPVRRAYIPKADGRQRPLGVPVLEDKIVQRATADVLNAIYESDFLGFSYGFRPGRNQHDALDALAVGVVAGHTDPEEVGANSRQRQACEDRHRDARPAAGLWPAMPVGAAGEALLRPGAREGRAAVRTRRPIKSRVGLARVDDPDLGPAHRAARGCR